MQWLQSPSQVEIVWTVQDVKLFELSETKKGLLERKKNNYEIKVIKN
jgi:hypothetical protein